MIFLIILNVYELNIKNLNDKFLLYKKTKNESAEKEFLKIYNSIKPVGFDIYIQYLLLKKDNKKVKDEMKKIFNTLNDEDEIKDTLKQFFIYRSVFNSIVILRDSEDFYKNLLEFIKITSRRKFTIPSGLKGFDENRYKIEIKNLLLRYGDIDSFVKYKELDFYLSGEILRKVKEKREEGERKKNLIFYLKKGILDSALIYTRTDYEKALVYSYFNDFDKAELIIKMEYKNKELIPIFILLKSGDERGVKCISSKLLGLEEGLPEDNLSRFFYSLLFDTTLKFSERELEPYFLYLQIEDGDVKEDSLLKKYPDTSPAYIIRNLKR